MFLKLKLPSTGAVEQLAEGKNGNLQWLLDNDNFISEWSKTLQIEEILANPINNERFIKLLK